MANNSFKGSGNFCKCGCGIEISPWSEFFIGHYSRTPEILEKMSEANSKAYLDNPDLANKISVAIQRSYLEDTEGSHNRRSLGLKRARRLDPTIQERITKTQTGRLNSEESIHNMEQAQQKFWASKEGDLARQKISKANTNPNRKPWRTVEGWEVTRDLILERDTYTCQGCGFTSEDTSKLQVHHIDEDPENDVGTNLITTCASCNSLASSNLQRDLWKSFFEKKIKEIYSIGET